MKSFLLNRNVINNKNDKYNVNRVIRNLERKINMNL